MTKMSDITSKIDSQNQVSSRKDFIEVPRLRIHVEGSLLDKHPIAKSIETFQNRVRDIAWAFAVAVPHAQRSQQRLMRRLAGMQRGHLDTINSTKGTEQAEAVAQVLDTARSIESILKSRMPSSIMAGLFIELFCEFDNFLGDLVRGINSLDESKFYHLKREITIGELKRLPTIDALRDDLLEKEIESLRRESYPKQFQTLEKEYDLVLTKFDEWSTFVEASQRRNLFTHAGGVVSEQYISVCRANGSSEADLPPKGEVLSLNLDYFFQTAGVVEVTGVLLGQTIWRKIFPKDAELADKHLNGVIYEKLRMEQFESAIRFANFGLQSVVAKHTSGVNRRIRLINKAIALCRINKKTEVDQLLGSEDWTDTLRDFSLARAVLEGKYQDAASLMQKIGKEGELVTESAYRNWPLFWDFRKSPEFLAAYEFVFGYSFKNSVTAAAMGEANGSSGIETTTKQTLQEPPAKPVRARRPSKTAANKKSMSTGS